MTFQDPNARLTIHYNSWEPFNRCCRYIISSLFDGDQIIGDTSFHKAERICDKHRRKTDKESYEACQQEAINSQPSNPLASDTDWEFRDE